MSILVQEQQPAANPFQAPRTAHNARRRASNIAIVVLSLLATAFAVAVLLYLLLYVLRAGLPYINIDLFTKIPTPNGEPGGGIGNAIQGSLILVGLASLFGIPLGLFTGIYLSEFGGRGAIAMGVRFLVDVLAGVPTIIFGLFIWILIVVPQQSFSGLAGGLALGIIMIPIVARTSEEALRLVQAEGIRGSATTPFLLAHVARVTAGESIEANKALLVNNARWAARFAHAYYSDKKG